jgi:hypothetical protein
VSQLFGGALAAEGVEMSAMLQVLDQDGDALVDIEEWLAWLAMKKSQIPDQACPCRCGQWTLTLTLTLLGGIHL